MNQKYTANAKRSKELCKEMERLVAHIYYDKVFYRFEGGISAKLLHEVRTELDVIWDEQMKLFIPAA